MSLAAKLNDKDSQHDGYHETVITVGSPTVSIDGLRAARMGDPLHPMTSLNIPRTHVK